ncbi:RNA-guided endonuclease TnpB family protein [Haladaptatus pallidirubidus]|uniref:RNA-guided endonuclease TnpB family protein n=1 Tax=Haladaptatus pallidirubidus TaxID=1008152 RepID=A0AAV3UHB0_9EURY|nr:transposase [Haladaptatus pallidirubidus]
MVETVTKTLEATLAPPTQGKAVRLCRLLSTYQEALGEAFDSGADTMGGVSDVVTPYDLPYQAKAALCSYVPKLRKTYNAREIDDEHPLRLTNQAAKFDRDGSRHYEICWNVPLPGYGTNFWIPLRLNPEQQTLWDDLLEGDAKAGEIQLQQNRRSWVFHIAVEYEVDEPDTDGDETYIGFDIGESALITGCALKRNTPMNPILISGNQARHLRKEMFTTLKRLQQRGASEWRVDERFDHYQNALTDIVEQATRSAVKYAKQFSNPVIVMEDLSFIRERLDYSKFMNRRLHAWAFARLQGRIEDKAAEEGVRVEYVHAAYTSKTCHECGHIGRRSVQAEFRCTNDECWVSEYQGDINAAANIAGRVDPWGESVPWKPERNDMPRDGSGRDTATVHRKTSSKPAQMTLSAYSD